MNSTVATAPGALPAVGHALAFLRDPLAFLASLPADGDVVAIRLGPRTVVVACDPAVTREILSAPGTFDKGGPFYDKARLLLGNGLGTSSWQDHRWQRRVLQPQFHSAQIKAYATVMTQEAVALAASWQPGQVIDARREFQALTIQVLNRALFSLREDDQRLLARALPIAFDGVYWRMVIPLESWFRLPTPANRPFTRARECLRHVAANAIKEHHRTPDGPSTLLSTLLDARTDSGEALSEGDIHDQLVTMMFAGTDTTADTLASAFQLISMHPEVEERLHEEVSTATGGRPLTPDALPALDHTRRVILEALRMFPPGWIVTRVTTTDTRLAGHHLPAGTDVLCSPYLHHHDPALFPDPDRFDPDRWLPHRNDTVPRGAMIPFGGGNRRCIGDQFALTQATLVIAAIAAKWRLRSTSPLSPRPRMSLGPGRLRLICEPRTAANRSP
ncbi:cytochrome P450 [Streptomyces sp. NBC_01214]|uniref:cytochrome P450 n=1 Tax=Streptomyces sp. NBC_01214 TaxID=2903777 RepID=UPI002254EEA9|nr:cytochrome P450 [Streptomyces sp. NBC_01214]MCX4808821.1 cytochrome P450 [Streptomyces sp. NBC_01214]